VLEQSFKDIVLVGHTLLNARTKVFLFEFDCPVVVIPGQFIIIEFKTSNDSFQRSYSVARQINPKTVELCVSFKHNGKASPILFSALVGDAFKASMPQGRFTLPESPDPNCHLVMIATGTGVVPFVAMIEHLLNVQKHKGPITLYFGCRTEAELLYSDAFNALAKTHNNFNYIATLSQSDWSGPKGYVHAHYLSDFANRPKALFYLCGWQNMVKEARENIKSLGYSRLEIKAEQYD
jgi:CDP-4-dehydro-6-deoxyglucose reductase